MKTVMSPDDVDVLRELSNIGAGHATTSLSRLIGRRRIRLSVPRVEFVGSSEVAALVGDSGGPVVGVSFEVDGVLHGKVLIAFGERDARALAKLLTGSATLASEPLDDMERSALMEVGNILTSSYLNALAQMLGGRLVPSPPTLMEGGIATMVHRASAHVSAPGPDAPSDGGAATGASEVVVLVNEFSIENERFFGYFFLFPHPGSLAACLRAARGA